MTVIVTCAAAGWAAGWLWCARVLFRRWRGLPLCPVWRDIGASHYGKPLRGWKWRPADGAACAAAMLAATAWVVVAVAAAVRWQPSRAAPRWWWLTAAGRSRRRSLARGRHLAELERLHLGTTPGDYPPIPPA